MNAIFYECVADINPPTELPGLLASLRHVVDTSFAALPDLRGKRRCDDHFATLRIVRISSFENDLPGWTYGAGVLLKIPVPISVLASLLEPAYGNRVENELTPASIAHNMPFSDEASQKLVRIFEESTLNMCIGHDAGHIMLVDRSVSG